MGRTSNADQQLMQAALDLMWEESYGAVTIDDICKRAGVKTGSFYYFYKSKADLAVAALGKLWTEQWKPKLDSLFSPSLEPLDRLTNYLDGMHAMLVEQKQQHGKILGCPVYSVGSEVSTQEVDVNAVIRDILTHKRRYYESAIREAAAQGVLEPCDPAQQAMSLFGLVEGFVSQARIMNDPDHLRLLPAAAMALLRVKAKPARSVKAVPATA